MQKLLIIFLLTLSFSSLLKAQNEKKINIDIHGFVKVDYFFDSRQTVSAREGHFLLFPQPADFDIDNNDINANPNFNILAVQTRLNMLITGPDVYGAKSSAFIEGAFFGHSNADINGFRLRHAFAKLKWDNAELLMGQYWHPMFVTSSYPGVYSFNTGVPFQAFSRNPQIRLTYGKDFKILGTLYSQRDFASRGPNGTSSEYLRNSGIPAMNLQFQFTSGPIFGGAGVDYKVIRPESSVGNLGNRKSEVNLPALSYIAFLKLTAKNLQFKVEGTYGENMADLLMLGGIADYETNNDELAYSNFKTLALWADLAVSVNHMEFGLFGGYSKNLGINESLYENFYALGGNIDNMWRTSIRTAWISGPTKFGVEFETTSAQYGSLEPGNTEVSIDGVDPVINYRLLVIAMYKF